MYQGKALVHVFGRTESREWLHLKYKGFLPYFYVAEDEEEFIRTLEEVVGIERGFQGLMRTEYGYTRSNFIKIFLKNPKVVEEVRNKLTNHGCADVLYCTRFLIDKQIARGGEISERHLVPCIFEIAPRIWFLDIETAGMFAWRGDAPICMIGFYDTYDERLCHLLYHPNYEQHQEITYTKDLLTDTLIADDLFFFNDEKELLMTFVEILNEKHPDILCGHNILKFDALVIPKRMQILGMNIKSLSPIGEVKYIKPRRRWKRRDISEIEDREKVREEVMIRGITIIDTMKGYKKIKRTGITSGALDDIAMTEFHIGKLGHLTYLDIIRILKDDPRKLLSYNIRDILIVKEINKQFNIINYYLTLKRKASCEFSDAEYVGRVVDRFLLQFAYRNNIVLPSRPRKEYYSSPEELQINEGYEGGFVKEPEAGLWDMVGVFDLKSIYPWIIIAWNISPETFSSNGENLTPIDGVRFSKSPNGIFKQAIQEVLDEREEIRKLKLQSTTDKELYDKLAEYDHALKIIGNAFYGVCQYDTFRLYFPPVSAAIAAICSELERFLLKKISNIRNLKVLYSDTDSSFVQFKFEGKSKEEILELMFKLEKRINEVYLPEFCKKYGVEPILSIKLEKFYDRFGITVDAKKKRYFGHIVWRTNWVDDYDIKGFEYRRGDASQLTKRVQKTLISMLCQGKSWNEIAMYLLTEEKKILNGEYPIDEIGIPRGLSKDLDEYVNEDVHIKGIKYAREHLNLEIPEGIKAKRVYIKRVPKGYPSTESICFLHGEDVPQGFIVDWKMMAEKVLKDKVTDFIAFHGKKWVNVVENDLTQYCDS